MTASSEKDKKLDGISHDKTVRRNIPLKASQPSNGTNVYKDVEITKSKLKKLAQRWIGINKVRGFLTELWEALGINDINKNQQRGGNPSRYAAFILEDGTMLTITVRASTHNAKAKNYLKKGNINGDVNLSIVVQKRCKKSTFEANKDVQLSEYVYLEDRLSNIENPLSQIAMSIVGYLNSGKYIDSTGVAITHPKQNDENNIKEDITNNMKKQVVRLTEGDLHRIIKESVKKVLKESTNESLNRTHIVYDGIDLELSMNGEDMYIEFNENNRWILAGYYANEKLWIVQENLDSQMVGDGEDDIIVIAKTKSMPEALSKLSQYIKQVIPLKEDRMKPFSEYEYNIGDYNLHRLHTLDRTTDKHSDWKKGDHAYCDSGELYPSADFTDERKDFGFPNDADAARNFLAQKDFNKRWKDMQDRLKYTKQANSRPLHRKGSLNREL